MDPIHAKEGWFVSHLFYRVNRIQWDAMSAQEQSEKREHFRQAIETFARGENCQIHSYSIWGLKADLGFMMVCPELHRLNQLEVELSTSLGSGVLEPVHSFISMSEISEYMSQDKDYSRTLQEKEGLSPESLEYQKKMEAFRERMQVYINERLYPQTPEHSLMCFYPMNKSRVRDANWYMLDFDERKRYMASHAITGRNFATTVKQLVTGSIGLDDWEWGVTLFSEDPYYFKKILYEMRYDEASARFGEFGSFYIGIRLQPKELLERIRL